MKNLIFKNLTSADKKRKTISISEITDSQGIHSIVQRHFVYIAKEVYAERIQNSPSEVRIVKERNTRERRESFFCKVKGQVYISNNDRLFLICFLHSLKIELAVIAEGAEVEVNKNF